MSVYVKVESRCAGETLVVYVSGYLNSFMGEEIKRIVEKQIVAGGRNLLLNFEGTRMMNSVGISSILAVLGKMQDREGRAAFCALTGMNREIFRMTGASKKVKSFDTEDEALHYLRAAC